MTTQTERDGVEAIIFLESLVGKEVDPGDALRNWQGMQQKDRDLTMRMARHYRALADRQRKRDELMRGQGVITPAEYERRFGPDEENA